MEASRFYSSHFSQIRDAPKAVGHAMEKIRAAAGMEQGDRRRAGKQSQLLGKKRLDCLKASKRRRTCKKQTDELLLECPR
jgi:hypothetical protein